MRSLNIRLTLTVFALLVGAMLLIDIVMSGMWAGRTRREHRTELQALVEHARDQLHVGGGANSLKKMVRGLGHCLFVRDMERGLFLFDSCENDATARRHAEAGGNVASSPWYERRLYAEARVADRRSGRSLRVMAVEGPDTAWRAIVDPQPIVGFYVLINALVLGLVALSRFTEALSRPLRNLAAAAERYREDEPGLFPEQSTLGEVHRLTFSLNRMVRRIEQNRLELRQAAEELADKNRQILAQQREMVRAEKLAATGRLAAGLAHEIGNPLGVVQGYLELLGMPDCGEQERRDYAANALEETRRMHRLVGTLLQAARQRPGQAEQAAERLDLNAFLAEFVETMRLQSLFKNIEVCLDVESTEARVEAPPDALRQVLLNAFLNAADAIRAVRESGGRIELNCQQVELDGRAWLVVAVADNGCGLAPEHEEKIFDHFFTTKEPGAGTGLGLSVSLALVEDMGGLMRAENREAGGMALHIILPLAEGAETEP